MPLQITTAEGMALRAAKTAAGTNPLDNLTLAQATAWVNTNVTDLPSAKNALIQLVKLVFLLQVEINRKNSG